jgi:hypothetical protein
LDQGVTPSADHVSAMAAAWQDAKKKIFAGKSTKPDAEDADVVNHLTWYEATNYQRPYPGESAVRWPSEFKNRFANRPSDLDD